MELIELEVYNEKEYPPRITYKSNRIWIRPQSIEHIEEIVIDNYEETTFCKIKLIDSIKFITQKSKAEIDELIKAAYKKENNFDTQTQEKQ